jgi:hypothetical protein
MRWYSSTYQYWYIPVISKHQVIHWICYLWFLIDFFWRYMYVARIAKFTIQIFTNRVIYNMVSWLYHKTLNVIVINAARYSGSKCSSVLVTRVVFKSDCFIAVKYNIIDRVKITVTFLNRLNHINSTSLMTNLFFLKKYKINSDI